MSCETVDYNVDNGVATLTFNRPESLNSFNDKMISESLEAVKQVHGDPAVRCLVITGTGRAFSAGQDLKDVQSREEHFSIGEHLRRGYNRLVMKLVQLEKPVIAAINGVTAGAGCGIALAADIRIASHTASFILSFSRVGLIPDSGLTWTLTRLVGYARAYEMAVTAESIPAEKALAWGIVNDVVPSEQLMEVTSAWSNSLASGPTFAFGLTKRAMNHAMSTGLTEALEYEASVQDIAGRSLDFNEGVAAFVEKREPNYRGE
jgi:2-(1,2-epoxy-1,2-dihydrophenyl)acetyl-CoA isomerase